MEIEVQNRLNELETKLDGLAKQLYDNIEQTTINDRNIFSLNSKIDGIREDLRDIKKLGDNLVPRVELETRLREAGMRVEALERSYIEITNQMHTIHIGLLEKIGEVNKNLQHNTIATYSTIVTIVLALATIFGYHAFGH